MAENYIPPEGYIPREGLAPHFDLRGPYASEDGGVVIPESRLPYKFNDVITSDDQTQPQAETYPEETRLIQSEISYVDWMDSVATFIEELRRALYEGELMSGQMSSLLLHTLGETQGMTGPSAQAQRWANNIALYNLAAGKKLDAFETALNDYNDALTADLSTLQILGDEYGLPLAFEEASGVPVDPLALLNPPNSNQVTALQNYLQNDPNPIITISAPEEADPDGTLTANGLSELETIWKSALQKKTWNTALAAWNSMETYVGTTQFTLLDDIIAEYKILKSAEAASLQDTTLYFFTVNGEWIDHDEQKITVESELTNNIPPNLPGTTGNASFTFPDWTSTFALTYPERTLLSIIQAIVGIPVNREELDPALSQILDYLEIHTTEFEIGKFFDFAISGKDITFPASFYTKFPGIETLVKTIEFSSGGVDLSAKSLEMLLASALLNKLSKNESFPPSSRLFASIIYSTMQLMASSALLASIPAAGSIVNLLGSSAISQFTLSLAVGLAITNNIIGLVNQNTLRAIISGMIQGLGMTVREFYRTATEEVKEAEAALAKANASGNSGQIAEAERKLAEALGRLEALQPLNEALSSSTVGSLAALANQMAGSLNISMLAITLAFFSKTIGLPGIVPQLFANFSGLPLVDILAAMTSGSSVLAQLKNPNGVASLKETLIEESIKKLKLQKDVADVIINRAVNNILLQGDFGTVEAFMAALEAELIRQGLHAKDAQTLAQTAGGLGQGIWFLNLPFQGNFDPSAVAAAVAGNLLGANSSIQLREGQLLEAMNRIQAVGGYATVKEFRDKLTKELQGYGLNEENSLLIANNVAAISVGIDPLLSSGPGPILGLKALAEQIQAHIIGTLTPSMGKEAADKYADQVLLTLFGSTTIDMIEKKEYRTPNSLLNQILDQLAILESEEDRKLTEVVNEALYALLAALMMPKAEIAYLIESLGDHASTFVGTLIDAMKGKKNMDITV